MLDLSCSMRDLQSPIEACSVFCYSMQTLSCGMWDLVP